jgi:hypothetical protein
VSEQLYPSEALIINDQRPIRVIVFPGERGKQHNLSVGIWCLSRHELAEAEREAAKYLQDICKVSDAQLAVGTSLAEEEIKVQLLFRALRDPKEPTRQFFKEIMHLRTRLYADEITALYSAYLEFVEERSPLRKCVSSEEIDQLVDSLGKGLPANSVLSFYDTSSLKNIVEELAARLVTQMRASFLPSSGQSETTSDFGAKTEAGK